MDHNWLYEMIVIALLIIECFIMYIDGKRQEYTLSILLHHIVEIKKRLPKSD